jgi:hypothetical protein
MFRVVPPPIIRSAYNFIYSIWYLSYHYCYLPLSWKSWNRFECAVVGVRTFNVTSSCHKCAPPPKKNTFKEVQNSTHIIFVSLNTQTNTSAHVKLPHASYREIILKKCFFYTLVKCKFIRKETRLPSYIHTRIHLHPHTHPPTHTHARLHAQNTNSKVSTQFLIPLSSPLHMQTAKNL